MISKLPHQIVRKLAIAPRFTTNHAKVNTFQSNFLWWPLWVVGGIGCTRLFTKMLSPATPEDESQRTRRLYAQQEKRVRRCSQDPETLGEKIAANIHEYVATPIVRKICDLELQHHLASFDMFGLFCPKRPILPFYILYMLISFLFAFISIFFGWGPKR